MSEDLIRRFCLPADLRTPDPYDVWTTPWGCRVKEFYYRHPTAGIVPAAACTLFDQTLNHRARLFYQKREHPVVRAFAALSLLQLHSARPDPALLQAAELHLAWLHANPAPGLAGAGWGLNFPHVAGADLFYPTTTAFSTITPYILEAFVLHHQLTGSEQSRALIARIFTFFDQDIQAMAGDLDSAFGLATSYAPFHDRIVVNAVSYTMFALARCLSCLSPTQQARTERRIHALFTFIRNQQRTDGSWLYSPEGRSFIDCFHSCIVLKNLVKTARLIDLPAAPVISAGYSYLLDAFYDPARNLFRRFSIANKPGIVKFDLYDNAEMINLAVLQGDIGLAGRLRDSVFTQFYRHPDFYSHINLFGQLRNRNHLRWAVMPFLYSLSCLETV